MSSNSAALVKVSLQISKKKKKKDDNQEIRTEANVTGQ